jgi:hypothetical protein
MSHFVALDRDQKQRPYLALGRQSACKRPVMRREVANVYRDWLSGHDKVFSAEHLNCRIVWIGPSDEFLNFLSGKSAFIDHDSFEHQNSAGGIQLSLLIFWRKQETESWISEPAGKLAQGAVFCSVQKPAPGTPLLPDKQAVNREGGISRVPAWDGSSFLG